MLSRYDQWVTREPDYSWAEPFVMHCERCGAFLSKNPDHHVYGEEYEECDGIDYPEYGPLCVGYGIKCPGKPHLIEMPGLTASYRKCHKCTHVNKELEW